MSNRPSLEQVLDEREITEVLVKYATYLDGHNWTGLDEVFVADATATYQGIGDFNSRDAIRTMVRGALEVFGRTQHLLGDYRIALEGDRATAKCYLQAIHVRPEAPGGGLLTVWGEYRDRLERRPEGWRIVHRELEVFHLSGDLGGTPLAK